MLNIQYFFNCGVALHPNNVSKVWGWQRSPLNFLLVLTWVSWLGQGIQLIQELIKESIKVILFLHVCGHLCRDWSLKKTQMHGPCILFRQRMSNLWGDDRRVGDLDQSGKLGILLRDTYGGMWVEASRRQGYFSFTTAPNASLWGSRLIGMWGTSLQKRLYGLLRLGEMKVQFLKWFQLEIINAQMWYILPSVLQKEWENL